MIRTRHVIVAALALTLAPLSVHADVKTEEKSLVKFEGMLGRVMGLFGGRAAREGIVSTVAVSGNRKASLNESTGQIVDLAEEKIYDLDLRNKSYTVTTFAELRRRMEEARKRAESQAERPESRSGQTAETREPGYEIDFDLKESGQRKTINSFDCREVVMTITVRQKGKTLEQGGGLVLRANNWLAPKIAAVSELADFDRRYAEKLAAAAGIGASAEQMAAAMAMYPAMQQALSRFRAENVNVDGTAISTVVTFEAAKNPEETTQQADNEPAAGASGGVGGVLGGFGRRVMRRRQENTSESQRATIMTMTHELLKVQTSLGLTDLAIPAGFKQK